LIVCRFPTARARHHSIGFPSIFRSTLTTRTTGVFCDPVGALAEGPADLR
jgi:hypothetical protein